MGREGRWSRGDIGQEGRQVERDREGRGSKERGGHG